MRDNRHLSRQLSFLVQCCPTVVLVVAMAMAAITAEDDSQPFIGFRNDGTGVFPPDCDPIVNWQERDWVEGKYVDFKGRTKKGLTIADENPKNIVWKTPLRMECNGGMIVAGGRLLLMRDRGGIGFAFDEDPGFLGEELVCLDPADGKVLWRTDLHHLDLLPSDVQQQVTEALREQITFYPKVFGAHERWYKACWQRTKKPAPPKDEHEKMYAEAAAEYRQYLPAVPATLAEQRASKEWKADGYIQVMFQKIENKYFPESLERQKLLSDYGYGHWNAWFGQGSFVGSAMQTPVSDGEHVYMNTMHGDAFCYTLAGELVWKQWYGYEMTRGEVITSPILVGDLLIIRGRMAKAGGGSFERQCWMAVDKHTGEIVWQTPKSGGRSYTDASPTHHRLAIAGDESQMLDVLWCPTGQVLRVEDGQVLATELGCHGNGRPWAVQGDVLAIINGSSEGGRGEAQGWEMGLMAFRLQAPDRDQVTAELLWHNGKKDHPYLLVAKDGVLYGARNAGLDAKSAHALDLYTGKELSRASFPRDTGRIHHLSAIAGGHFFGLSDFNDCAVVSLGDQGRNLSFVAVNRLGARRYRNYDFFNEGAQPFFSGNRIFIRSYINVYCIGNPGEAMRLSEVHR